MSVSDEAPVSDVPYEVREAIAKEPVNLLVNLGVLVTVADAVANEHNGRIKNWVEEIDTSEENAQTILFLSEFLEIAGRVLQDVSNKMGYNDPVFEIIPAFPESGE